MKRQLPDERWHRVAGLVRAGSDETSGRSGPSGLVTSVMLSIVVLVVLLLADAPWRGSDVSAASTGPEMTLAVKSGATACENNTCSVPLQGQFTLAVEIVTAPASGYILAQSYVDYGAELTYKATELLTGEFTWADCSVGLRSES